MAERFSWEEIQQRYNGEWVELVDYEWTEGEPYPQAGIVRVHAPNRSDFYKLANQDSPRDSAILFIGTVHPASGIVLCSSMMQIKDRNANHQI